MYEGGRPLQLYQSSRRALFGLDSCQHENPKFDLFKKGNFKNCRFLQKVCKGETNQKPRWES